MYSIADLKEDQKLREMTWDYQATRRAVTNLGTLALVGELNWVHRGDEAGGCADDIRERLAEQEQVNTALFGESLSRYVETVSGLSHTFEVEGQMGVSEIIEQLYKTYGPDLSAAAAAQTLTEFKEAVNPERVNVGRSFVEIGMFRVEKRYTGGYDLAWGEPHEGIRRTLYRALAFYEEGSPKTWESFAVLPQEHVKPGKKYALPGELCTGLTVFTDGRVRLAFRSTKDKEAFVRGFLEGVAA